MKRTLVVLALVALAATIIWLKSRDNSASGPNGTASKTIQPKSGGELVLLNAGQFTMGGSGHPDEQPHAVSVSSFYIDTNLVTQELYERVMGRNPAKRKVKDHPVEQVTWFGAIRFCNKCSELDGLTPCYDLQSGACNFAADGYRLPTEAEWEYACRAGNMGEYAWGDDASKLKEYAWCSGEVTHPVGQKTPNAWGLYDMNGAVWQWCNDFYAEDYYQSSPTHDPHGPASGEKRVMRGGAWTSPPEQCRAAFRKKETPSFAEICFGNDPYGVRRVRRERADQSVSSGPAPAPSTTDNVKPTPADEDVPQKKSSTMPNSGKLDAAALRGTIVFTSDRSGKFKIWTMQASGKSVRQLTQGTNDDASPQFSPDGARILYTTVIDGHRQVWMMKRDGTQAQSVTNGEQAAWSPDASAIVFIRNDQTYVRELAAGSERRLTPENWERCGVPAWSPDGKSIAVASRHLENIGIFLLSLDGKENHALKTGDPCCTPAFSSDGKRLLCQTVKGHVNQVELDGKSSEQVTFGNDFQHDARYSPDGGMIIFARANDAQGPWQIWVQKLDDEDSAVQLTTEGSNLQPDWHKAE
jgi:formylglycine-generating enzyme required for sulfatase activity